MRHEGPATPALRRVMRAREYFTLAFGSIVGVGWMILMGDWLQRGGPAGAVLGFSIGGAALVPVVCVYGRLAARLPGAATEIAYTGAAYPRAVSFATGWAMTLANAIVCPFEAVAMGRVAAYVFPGLDSYPLYQIGEYPVYLPHLLLGLATAAVIITVNYRGIHHSAALQNVTTFGLLAIFVLFTIFGLLRGNPENVPPLFVGDGSHKSDLWAVLAVLQIVPYYMMGFETIPKCSEEAVHGFEPTRFLYVMLTALCVATFFYVAVIAVVALLQPWPELVKIDFATAVAFERAFGWPWLVRLIMLGVVLSLVKVLNGNFLAATRLIYAMGSRGLLGSRLGAVHPKHQTPHVAVALVGALTLGGCFLGRAVLVPISEVGSLCGAAVWLITALAYCRGAAGSLSASGMALGVVAAFVAAAMMVISALGFTLSEWSALAAWTALGLVLWWRASALSHHN